MEYDDISQYTRPQKDFKVGSRTKRYAAPTLKSFLDQLFTKSHACPFTLLGLFNGSGIRENLQNKIKEWRCEQDAINEVESSADARECVARIFRME